MLLAQRSLVRRITGVRLQVRMLHHTTKTSTATSQIDTTSAGDFKHSEVLSKVMSPLMSINHVKEAPSLKNYHNNKITYRSYLNLNPEKYDLDEEEKIVKYYSSKNDGVEVQPYAPEIQYLKNILESFLEQKYFDKIDQVLKSLSKLVNATEFTDICNKYLENILQDDLLSLQDLNSIIGQLQDKCKFKTNTRTEAIILGKMLNDSDNAQSSISEFFGNMEKQTIVEILRNMDVIGVDNLYKVFDCDSIDASVIPKELQEIYQEHKLKDHDDEIAEDILKLQENKQINPLDKKSLEELLPVDSFGLQVIRHSLLGLKPDLEAALKFADQVEKIIEDVDDEVLNQDIMSGKINYFEMYSKLKTEEQRQAFNEALNAFNLERQKQIEIRGIEGAKEKWKHDFEELQKRGDLNLSKGLNAQCYKWLQDVLPVLEKEYKLCEALINGNNSVIEKDDPNAKDRAMYAPFILKISPDKAIIITILELFKLHSTGGVVRGFRAYKAIQSVGKAIEAEYRIGLQAKKENKLFSQKHLSPQLQKLMRRTMQKGNESTPEWDDATRARIGGVLVSILMSVAKVNVRKETPQGLIEDFHPAFYHGMQFIAGNRVGVIKVHTDISNILSGTSLTESIQPQALPMLVEPKPWNSFYGGGSLYSKTPLVRVKDSPETEAYLKAANERGNLTGVFEGLNVLGNTAWTVNKKVFNVISHYWNSGEEFLSIPPVSEEPQLPQDIPGNSDPQKLLHHTTSKYQALDEYISNKSQRCDNNYRLEIARAFIGEKLFFPHNLDFRGRAYPISPHFNHLGGDLTRSLFLFWDGKELGEEGLNWLKIQLANVYGVDKESLAKRVEFVNENLEKVLESAADPFATDAWWQKAEKPWQALSVCFELAEAYKLDDPTKFVSHLPVHQDGTCNGLQHYAALGGDVEGANQVNLNPSDKPQDVYTYVAKLVETRVKADAEKGDELAIFLQDKIKRKVVKQTVMTNVYGVTFIGAIEQIRKQIIHLFPKDADHHAAARYLAVQVFASIRELFENAHFIQAWLTESAKRITKSVTLDFGESQYSEQELLSTVIWTTPLGLPCVQPYRLHKKKQLKTAVQDLNIVMPSNTSAVDSRKQQNGFPPNFIHSLDATHMLMTATKCAEFDLNFASVHDSFWTHAADVPQMNRIIREQFVKLHTTNLIELLKEEFSERYKDNYQVLPIPNNHELARKVKAIKKEWAEALNRPVQIADELYMERKRLQMLESEDPEEVEVAKNMETTISITMNYKPYEFANRQVSNSFQILVPIQFPEVPSKGEFDVNLVKQSQYFFS